MDLSPDGTKIVYVGPGPGRSTIVHVASLADGASKEILGSPGTPESLNWCSWVSNSRMVCSYSAIKMDGGIPIGFSRLISLNEDGTDIKRIGSRTAYQSDGYVLDWLPGNGENILMSRNGAVEKVNVRTLRSTQVEASRAAAASYMTMVRVT